MIYATNARLLIHYGYNAIVRFVAVNPEWIHRRLTSMQKQRQLLIAAFWLLHHNEISNLLISRKCKAQKFYTSGSVTQ